MALQPVFSALHSPKHRFPRSNSFAQRICASSELKGINQRFGLNSTTKCWWGVKELPAIRLSRVPYVSHSDLGKKLVSSRNDIGVVSAGKRRTPRPDLSLGKPGSASFYGLTHEMVDGREFLSSPFKEGTGTFEWLVAPAVLLLSVTVPSLFVETIVNATIKNVVLAETLASLASEVAFYTGFAYFLLITDRVQRPYLQVSTKSWSLITGLNGYLMSSFLTMGIKVFLPLLTVLGAWPHIGIGALVSVTPFFVGCLAQYYFETSLKGTGCACWPLVPIIFEMYRIYQVTKACHFMGDLLAAMPVQGADTPQLIARKSMLYGMVSMFQVLGLVCLWSLLTFLVRLAPSKPVADQY